MIIYVFSKLKLTKMSLTSIEDLHINNLYRSLFHSCQLQKRASLEWTTWVNLECLLGYPSSDDNSHSYHSYHRVNL